MAPHTPHTPHTTPEFPTTPPLGPDATTNGTHAPRPRAPWDDHGALANGARGDLPPGFDAHASVPDALAALFLGDLGQGADPGTDDGTGQAQTAHARGQASSQAEAKPLGTGHRPELTLLVLGNLPVYAGAWASQYARSRAKASGRPLGLLSLSDESARLEVFGGVGPGSMLADRLDRALAHVAHLGADLIVRLPESEAGWIAGQCGAGHLAILTGADDPAIVAAYQSLKAIIQDLPGGAMQSHRLRVLVTIAGCPEPRAGESAAKLTLAAERFLGLPVGVEPAIAQIDAGVSMELYHGAAPAWADVPDLLAAARANASERRAERRAEPSPAPAPPVATRPPQPEPVAIAGGAGETLEPRRAPAPAPALAKGPIADANGPIAADTDRPMPKGVQPLEVTCPYARSVGLGVDAQGVPHAIAWANDSESAPPAVRDLVVASSWLRDHAELVACLVGRPLRADTSVRHLVLADGRGALALAQGDLRVHVSAAHPSQEGRGVVVIDLN